MEQANQNEEELQTEAWSLSWVGVTGISSFALGLGLAIGFGVYTLELHSEFEDSNQCNRMVSSSRCASVSEQGGIFGPLTTVSIGLAALGATLFVLDLVFDDL